MSNNRAEMKQKIEAWFDKRDEEMKKDLSRLIAIRSVRGPELDGAPYGLKSREVLGLAASMLEEHGFEATVFEDVVATAELGPAPPLLGILAHLDIVEEGEGWDTDPFIMTEKDGKLYGRGVIDNKGPAVAAMYAMYCVRDLYPELSKGLQLILGSSEETGFDDITRYMKKNQMPPHVFSPDSLFPVVNVEKGRFGPFFSASWEKDTALPRIISATGGKTMNIVPNRAEAVIEGLSFEEVEGFCRKHSELTGVVLSACKDTEENRIVIAAEGKASHAAMPQLGNNAQTALIGMLAAMPFAKSAGFDCICALSRLFPHGDNNGKAIGIAMSDEVTGELTVNFGVMRLTEYEFSGNFDCRSPACADDADLFGITEAAMKSEGIVITRHSLSKSHVTPEDSPFVQTLLEIYEDYTGNPRECHSMGGQTYVHDIPGGVVFGCAMPGANNGAHGPNEFFDVDQFILSAKIFTQVILDMCG